MAIYPYYYDYICYCGEWAVAMTVHCKPTYTWRSHTPGALEGRSAHVRGGGVRGVPNCIYCQAGINQK